MECDVTIYEEISEQSVAKAIADLNASLSSESEIPIVFCLNSPGGKLEHALKLVEFMETLTRDRYAYGGVTTLVKNGMDCRSSCAMIFMAGFYCHKYLCRPSRYLEPFATLGFHAPELDYDVKKDLVIRLSYAAAIEQLGFFAALDSNPNFFGSPSRFPGVLVENITRHHGDNFYFVDRLKDALMLDIGLTGDWKHPSNGVRQNDYEPLFHACDNYFWMNQISKGRPEPNYNYDAGKYDFDAFNVELIHHEAVYVEISILLGSGNTRWVACFLPLTGLNVEEYTGLEHFFANDSQNFLGVYPGLYSTLSRQNQLDTHDVGTADPVKRLGELTLQDAWARVNPLIDPSEYWLFWSMDSKLSDMGVSQ